MKQSGQNDVQQELDRAFTLLAAIPVSGDGVELMAGAKERLRDSDYLGTDLMQPNRKPRAFEACMPRNKYALASIETIKNIHTIIHSSQVFHGALFLFHLSSSDSLSLNVSMHFQNPEWR